jgi:hypothetical protein
MSLLGRALFSIAAVSLAVGCGSKGKGAPFSRPTLVSVNPLYLEDAQCGTRAGQMKSYVATLWDTTPFGFEYPASDCERTCGLYELREDGEIFVRPLSYDECDEMADEALPENQYLRVAYNCDWFQLPSSGLVNCRVPVGFSFIAVGHLYVGRVEGYERDDLVPLHTGSPLMTDPVSGAIATPTWVWVCTDPTVAVHNWDNPLVDCQLISDESSGSSITAIEVDTGALLGELECGDAPERIARFEIALNAAEPVIREVDCDAITSFTELADGSPLQDGSTYELDITAYATGSDQPTWQTSCYADSLPGVTVQARCGPLSPIP